MVEIFLPNEKKQELCDLLEPFESAQMVQTEQGPELTHTKLIMDAQLTEDLLDKLEAAYAATPEFRIIIVSVEATIPRIKKPEKTEAEEKKPLAKRLQFARVSREELHHDILEASRLSWLFVVMVALSSVVAAIGLLRNNSAVVIGAMVIAPLLGPNVALALASTLGDVELAGTAKKSNIVGITLPLVLAAVTGMIFANGTLPEEIISRTQVNLSDIVLALAAGSAATLSFTMAMSGTLIGVMVAVALMPPLVTFGIMLGCAEWQLAVGAGLLFATNLICINLAGVMTFLAQGVRPLWWWDKQRAKKATKRAMIIWLICLAVLIILIIASQKWILKS